MDDKTKKKKKEDNPAQSGSNQSMPDLSDAKLEKIENMVQNFGATVASLGARFDKLNDKVDRLTKADSQTQGNQITVNRDDKAASVVSNDEDSFGNLSDDGFGNTDFDEFSFDPRLAETNVGDDIDDDLAGRIDQGMIKNSSWEKSKKIVERYPRPGNVLALRTPAINQELLKGKDTKQKVSSRDTMPRTTQDLITASLSVCAGLMSDIKANNVTRSDMYDRMSDVTRLLMDAHKRVSQIRRNQLRSLLSGAYRGLCSSANLENDDNEWLFGHNLGRTAEDVAKAGRLTARMIDSSAKNGRQRGRGAPAPRGRFNPHYRRGNNQFSQKRKDGNPTFHQQPKFPKKE